MTSLAASPLHPARLRDRWLDRVWALRDRWLASPDFRRAAASFLLTRPVARRRARELFDVVAGFVYSQVLLACVRLRLFETLAEGPQTLDVLTARLDLAAEPLQCLLDAAEALQLVQRRSGGRFGLGTLGAPLLGNTAIAAMVEHHGALYADLRDPVALLRARSRGDTRSGELARLWPYAAYDAPGELPEDRIEGYSALMSASQPLVADEILAAYDIGRHRCLLDIGGGEATFAIRAAAEAPRLSLIVFDLPAVAGRAQQRLADAGLADRACACGGDFRHAPLPGGADLATLIRVVHDHDDATALALLKAAHAALPPGGVLLLAEPMAGTPGAEAMGGAYFGFYLLAMGRGRPRTRERLTALLRQAGFARVRALRTRLPLQTQLLKAERD